MVHFVGAGPGAPDLITVRGARLLGEADVVVWAGSLVNGELLGLCKEDCEIHDSSRLTLEETTAILSEADRGGKVCVRLHTGDPCLFGAIREQMEELDRLGVEYDVVPGVSSFCGAASAIKREYTVPGVSQTVIISRMEGRTPVPLRERISELSRHGASMVLFLSSGMIRELCVELLKGGAYTESTPCCVVYKATWADERIVEGTLSDIADKAEEVGVRKTALVLVGDFLGGSYGKSLLYDKSFSTEFRKAVEK
ncbi:MAG: precorrin-4 C(11)-methyltransferase [Treponema sp.]|nr:precorrin-4 C(11)-methyltransferase [Treponema sp.]